MHALDRALNLLLGTPKRAGTVKVSRFEKPLESIAPAGNLFGIDKDPAQGENLENPRVKVALVLVAEMVNGQSRNHGVEWTAGQSCREGLNQELGFPASQANGSALQHIGRAIEEMNPRVLDPLNDRRRKESRARTEIEDARGGGAKSFDQLGYCAVELVKAGNESASLGVVGESVPNRLHGKYGNSS
jgi:hypothetical protein